MKEYVKCAVCGRKYVGYVPEGGDGSGLQPRLHIARPQPVIKEWVVSNRKNGKAYCDGSFMEGLSPTDKERE